MELEKKILNASIGMFFSHGIKAVSMDDVAKAVGISKRTLYEHFGSKDALLMGCISDIIEDRSQKMSALIDTTDSFIELILRCVHEAIDFTQNIAPQFFEDLNNMNYAGAKAEMDSSMGKFRKRIERLVEKGKSDGLLRQDIDAEFTTFVMLYGNGPKPISQEAEASKWDKEWMLKQLTTIFLRGMATEKGIALMDQTSKRLEMSKKR